MATQFFLKRIKEPQVIPLGVFTLNTFYPAMPTDVLEILVTENQYAIQDESGTVFTIESFKEIIETINSSPPVMSLNI